MMNQKIPLSGRHLPDTQKLALIRYSAPRMPVRQRIKSDHDPNS